MLSLAEAAVPVLCSSYVLMQRRRRQCQYTSSGGSLLVFGLRRLREYAAEKSGEYDAHSQSTVGKSRGESISINL